MTRQPDENAAELLRRLHAEGVTTGQASAVVQAERISPAELAGAMHSAFADGAYPLVRFILAISFDHSGPALVPALCELVASDDISFGVEDAVQLLGEIGDVSAVPCLARTLLSPPAWDFSGYVGEKAVHALAGIDSDAARAAIRFAITSTRRRIWQATIRPLMKAGKAGKVGDDCLLAVAHRLVTEDPWSFYLEDVLPVLAAMNSPEAWRVLEIAADLEDEDNRALARELLRAR